MTHGLRSSGVSAESFYALATLAILGVMLYALSAIVLPFALAILLTAVLSPLVRRVERAGASPNAAVLIVCLLVGVLAVGSAVFAGRQVIQVVGELPKYHENIRGKFATLKETFQPALDWSQKLLGEWNVGANRAETNQPFESPPIAVPVDVTSTAAVQGPLAVRVVDPTPPELMLVRQFLAPALAPAASTAMIFVLTVFMLISRQDLRNRLIVLLGVDRVPGTTQLLEDAWHRVSKYLRMQLALNCVYGVAVFSITWGVGLPNAALWGLQAAVLRFIPFLGPLLAAGLPLAVAVAVSDGWLAVLVLVALFVVIELVMNNVLEPWLYGTSTGVSTVGIVVSVLFWTWLWGPLGLVLATPLTVCLTVLGRHLPALRFWATLLADESPLSPPDRLFQRLLAGDAFEALRIVEGPSRATAAEASERIRLLAASVERAAMDHGIGVIDDQHIAAFQRTFDAVWDEIRADFDFPTTETAPDPPRLAIMTARGTFDRPLAQLAAGQLILEGWSATLAERSNLSHDAAEQVCQGDFDAVVVAAAGPRAAAHARYACRQLRSAGWSGPVVVLQMSPDDGGKEQPDHIIHAGGNEVATSFTEMTQRCQLLRRRLVLSLTHPASPALTVP